MKVQKRDGSLQEANFEKIHWRIKSMCSQKSILNFQREKRVDAYNVFSKLPCLDIDGETIDIIAKKTVEGLYNGISTTELDLLSAETAQEMATSDPKISLLASRLLVSNMQKNIKETLYKRFSNSKLPKDEINKNLFKYAMKALYNNRNQHGEISPAIAPFLAAIADKYIDKINSIIDYSRDYLNTDYLGIKTLERGYLFKVHSMDGFSEKDILMETPAISDMRIAISLVCSPTPCPDYESRDGVITFILNNLDVLKPKSFVSNKIKPEVLKSIKNSKEPLKNKYVDKKLFREKYWTSILKIYESINITESQWRAISDIYHGMSHGLFTPATPSRFAMGTLKPQGSSCFLLAMQDDSLIGIYDTLTETSQISKHAGGVGLWLHNIRGFRSYIAGTNGHSNGIKPMLKVFDSSAAYVDQGGNKRSGSTAVYCEPWHSDIYDFVAMKRKTGASANRAQGLFYALWIPDEYFRCLKEGKPWYLFDPAVCPKLYDSYDETFSEDYLSDEYVKEHKKEFLFTYRYRKYIRQNKYVKATTASHLMEEIVETVRDSGVPYMLAKDACNRKSNQKNLGVIKSSNLCSEIIQYSSSDETSVCNLSSLCLNKFVREWRDGDDERFRYNVSLIEGKEEWMTFDFELFGKNVRIVQKYLDNLIDLNYYPTENARRSNLKHRPTGAGTQGESDMLAMLRIPWNSKEAHRLRFYIFERMYFECLSASCEISKEKGPYESFQGSPASQGILQFDMWHSEGNKISFPFHMPWAALKEEIIKFGLRNSLVMCCMPTASTSSIMGNCPSIEPFGSLIYVRKSGVGAITYINKALVEDLKTLSLWNKELRDKIIENHGSIQEIREIPYKVRSCYLTAYDLKPKDLIDASFVRAWFVDQSQSLNLFFENITVASTTEAWTHGWRRHLKTLSYYCRSRPATNAMKAQIATSNPIKHVETTPSSFEEESGPVCSRDNPNCLSCGS